MKPAGVSNRQSTISPFNAEPVFTKMIRSYQSETDGYSSSLISPSVLRGSFGKPPVFDHLADRLVQKDTVRSAKSVQA